MWFDKRSQSKNVAQRDGHVLRLESRDVGNVSKDKVVESSQTGLAQTHLSAFKRIRFDKGSPALDFQSWVFDKGSPALDFESWGFDKGLPALDFESWGFDKGLPALDFDSSRFDKGSPALDFESLERGHSALGDNCHSKIRCSICGSSCPRERDLKRHAKLHDPEPRSWYCKIAGCETMKGLKRKDKLMAHIRKCHPTAYSEALASSWRGLDMLVDCKVGRINELM